ncbi:S1 family peptidase [Nocardioides rotundus]|uniref:S1 family peptidase n=1 Tax=Nocardioides rotundus TaxID=1774216 RepID=UPI001CC1AD38|nr:S1 family peptidase [Nocardioides rotundus]
MRTRLLTAAAAAATLTMTGLVAAPATASTGGTVDSANQYSAVGMIAFYSDGGRYRCTATLVDSDTLLTAAHCTDGTDGATAVSFDWFIDDAPPADLPVASDPEAGYTDAEIESAGWLSGTAYTSPDYSDFTDMANWNDYGVIELDEPVTGIEPMSIAPVGTLDAIPTSQLRKTLFRAVGYGTEVRKAEEGPQKPTPMSYPMVRRYVDMPGQKLTPQILQTNGNPNDTAGTGGTCFGDSGGPLLLDGQIVGVTSFGYTSNCRYIDGYQRVDIQIAQDWLSQYVDGL